MLSYTKDVINAKEKEVKRGFKDLYQILSLEGLAMNTILFFSCLDNFGVHFFHRNLHIHQRDIFLFFYLKYLNG